MKAMVVVSLTLRRRRGVERKYWTVDPALGSLELFHIFSPVGLELGTKSI